MQVTIKLNDMFSYSIIPIIIIISILISIIIVRIYSKFKANKKEIPVPQKIEIKDKIKIKEKYLNKIEKIIIDFNSNIINNREAYQKLSIIIRKFIYEMTNINVQNYTLSDIKKINMPILYELVNEYYNPEFSEVSKGNIILSLEKAKKVIKEWN